MKNKKSMLLILAVAMAFVMLFGAGCISQEVYDLINAKNAKIAQLNVYNEEDYRAEEWAEIQALYNGAVDEINALTNIEDINAFSTEQVNVLMDAILTRAEIEEIERVKTLEEAKEKKIKLLGVYLEEDYRAAEWEALSKIYNDAVAAINALETVEEVEAFDVDSVNAAMDAIKTDAELTAEEEARKPSITTTLEDGKTYGSEKLTFDVFAKNPAGEKISPVVTFNGNEISPTWDDSEKTSFTVEFTQEDNVFVISAEWNGEIRELTFNVKFIKAPATFTLAVEALTIGCDYIIEPSLITINDEYLGAMAEYFEYESVEVMEERLNAAHVLVYALYEQGYECSYTGGLSSGFYMSSITGFTHRNNIPEELVAALEESGMSPETEPWDENCLGEFDYTWMSGWMYSVNGVFPNVGFADYYIQDGDIMRVQFTLAMGADIGNGWGSDMFERVNTERDTLTQAMAKAIAMGKQETEEYTAALEVMRRFGITRQEAIDAANALTKLIEG